MKLTNTFQEVRPKVLYSSIHYTQVDLGHQTDQFIPRDLDQKCTYKRKTALQFYLGTQIPLWLQCISVRQNYIKTMAM